MRISLVPPLLITAIGCGAELGPQLDPATLDIQFASTVSRCSQEIVRTFEPRVVGAAQTIEVDQIFRTGSGGYELVPAIEAPAPGELVLTVTGIDHGGIARPICHPYSVVISGVPVGRYTVRVAHAKQGQENVYVVPRTTVVVE